jgi:hypothetical protein
MSCLLAMSGYATSACWQTENVKPISHYVVRSSETVKPQPNKTPGKRPGRNSSSGSVGSMSLPVPSVRKEECVEWNFYCPTDATVHRSYSDESSEHGTNKLFSSLRKSFPVSPRPPIAKNHSSPLFSSIRRPICKDIGPRNEPVSLQKDYQDSLSTCLSIEKNKEDRIESP